MRSVRSQYGAKKPERADKDLIIIIMNKFIKRLRPKLQRRCL